MVKLCLTLVLTTLMIHGYSQDRSYSNVRSTLDSLSVSAIPQLNEPVDISLTGVSLAEFVRSVSNHIGLNINVDPTLTFQVNTNYSGVAAKDLIYMLCQEYHLEFTVYGNIISLKPRMLNDRKGIIAYDPAEDEISYELKDYTLDELTKELAEKSPYNFFLTGEMGLMPVNGYVKSLDAVDALNGLANSNHFVLRQVKDRLFFIEPKIDEGSGQHRDFSLNSSRIAQQVTIDDEKMISINGTNLPGEQLFQFVASKLNIPFHQMKQLEGTKNLSLNKVDFATFMNAIVSGTNQTYKFQNEILYLGDRNRKDMKTSRLVTFNYRRVDSLSLMLPKNIFQDAEIREFPELNGLIVIGDADVTDDITRFLKTIDVSVPVVLIDVIIVDVSNTQELETGIEAGLLKSSDEPVETGGSLSPEVDYTMDGGSINKAISRLGLTKLGRVSPNFYVKLKALETNGVINIRSTPQLSTLNGHAANLSIGETQYYEERRNVYQGSLNPQLEALTSYLPVEAQLGVIIKPFVTGNGDVTLNIEVEQSNFTERFKEDAPPGLISRNFKSMIRVKNQEMVLLGGLEEIQKEKSRSGLPGIARVPVLSWFFTHRTSKDNKSRLNIFIKPTILY